jgi:hypothetical protein
VLILVASVCKIVVRLLAGSCLITETKEGCMHHFDIEAGIPISKKRCIRKAIANNQPIITDTNLR